MVRAVKIGPPQGNQARSHIAEKTTPKRSRSGANTLALACAVLLLAQLACAGLDLLDGNLAFRETVQDDWIRVTFTDPPYPEEEADRRGGIDQELIAVIDHAERTVDLVAYDFDLRSVAESLIAAEERGVRVRVVTESKNVPDNRHVLIDLERAGIPVIEDNRENGLMHNKFVVIDGASVWTGSWNMTESGTYRNNNNAVLIRSQALADNYTSEFEEMAARQFGPDSPTDTPYSRLTITVEGDGESQRRIEVENYFSPEDDVDDAIIAKIREARRRIRFMAFVFTSDAIADAMLERAEDGVIVQGVMESRNVNGQYDEYRRLQSASHDVLVDGNPYIMHHKVIIIDDETVIFGSYNFSRSAEISNDENVLIIHDPTVTGLFVEEFRRMYQQARTAE